MTGLQPRVRGWLLASLDGKTSGLIPANHVKILGKREGSSNASEVRVTYNLFKLVPPNPENLQGFSLIAW